MSHRSEDNIDQVVQDNITPAEIGAEPTISPKNTAFNKNFGTGSGDVTEGNDSRLSDARTPLAHASTHTNGTDDIQSATNSQKGLATASHITDIETNNAKVSNATHTGDVTGSTALTIANNAVTNAKASDMTGFSIKTKPTTGSGDPTDLAIAADGVPGRVGSGNIVSMTPTQSTARLNTFTSSLKGLAPSSGGGTTNFLRADGTWAAPSGGGGSSFPEFQFYADQLDSPNNSDWTVNALARSFRDSNNNALTVRQFDDTTEEGVGFIVKIPSGAVNIIIDLHSRAETSAGSNLNVVPKLYVREMPDNAAVESWSAGTDMTTITMGTSNEFFQYDTQTIALSTLSLVAGRIAQFELTRNTGSGSDTLVDDWDLLMLGVRFS